MLRTNLAEPLNRIVERAHGSLHQLEWTTQTYTVKTALDKPLLSVIIFMCRLFLNIDVRI